MAYQTFRDVRHLQQYLRGMNSAEKLYQQQKDDLNYQVETLEEAIERLSLSNSHMYDMGSTQSKSYGSDQIFDTLSSAYRDISRQENELYVHACFLRERTSQIRFVRFCIRQLPPDEISLIVLINVEHWNYEKYGEMFNLSRSAVHHRLQNAAKHLYEIYHTENQLLQDSEESSGISDTFFHEFERIQDARLNPEESYSKKLSDSSAADTQI